MKITYFNYVWDIEGISAGAATKAREIIGGLNRHGHETSLIWRTPQPNGHVTVSDKVRSSLKPKLQKYLHEPKKLVRNVPNLMQEWRILKNEKPDILFARLELYNVTAALLSKMLSVPLAIEADCPVSYEHKNFYGKAYQHIGNLSEKLELQTLHSADAVIAISTILKNYYVEQGIAAEKIHVIPNGADPEKFAPRPKPAELVKAYDLNGKTVIGWIGALVGWSGIEKMLSMARQILQSDRQAAFMMVGGGDNQALFQKELQAGEFADRVILPGSVPHEAVGDYLACMDIVLAPYPKLPFWYASSMKIFEYMAAGKALISSAVGQVNEVIQDGQNGLLYDPDNAEELTEKVKTLLKDEALRQRLGEQARSDLLANYTWSHHAKQIAEIFQEIVARKQNVQHT
ncbi:glycosyltransferase family 4 protein [candidate division KSB1 bacterium]|nr:glycosyltransferase family 4 protein [candidate division KSB1 bacterium]